MPADGRYVTVFDLALHRLGHPPVGDAESPTTLTGADFEAAGLPMLGGCEGCSATIAAYNAHPSTTGYLRCGDCIGSLGWRTVEAADRAIFQEVK